MSTDGYDDLRKTLEGLTAPVEIFVRNDDVGWADDRLESLLDLFERHRRPIDLAVIPSALSEPAARRLCDRVRQASATIGLHQHGFDHSNHEQSGRKCEFGPSRAPDQQYDDIERGRWWLRQLLDVPIDPIFTPPWNRCTAATVVCMNELEIRVLSRDATADEMPIALTELPVTLDWQRAKAGTRVPFQRVLAELVRQLAEQRRVGIMLHHATMTPEDHEHLHEVFSITSCYSYLLWKPMRAICDPEGHWHRRPVLWSRRAS